MDQLTSGATFCTKPGAVSESENRLKWIPKPGAIDDCPKIAQKRRANPLPNFLTVRWHEVLENQVIFAHEIAENPKPAHHSNLAKKVAPQASLRRIRRGKGQNRARKKCANSRDALRTSAKPLNRKSDLEALRWCESHRAKQFKAVQCNCSFNKLQNLLKLQLCCTVLNCARVCRFALR